MGRCPCFACAVGKENTENNEKKEKHPKNYAAALTCLPGPDDGKHLFLTVSPLQVQKSDYLNQIHNFTVHNSQ